jgi:hypothetical protein
MVALVLALAAPSFEPLHAAAAPPTPRSPGS